MYFSWILCFVWNSSILVKVVHFRQRIFKKTFHKFSCRSTCGGSLWGFQIQELLEKAYYKCIFLSSFASFKRSFKASDASESLKLVIFRYGALFLVKTFQNCNKSIVAAKVVS